MNAVDRVKEICKSRKIPVSRLEKDLGFANGYIGQLRKGQIPGERLLAISKYLSVPIEHLLGDSEEVFYSDSVSQKMCAEISRKIFDDPALAARILVPIDVKNAIYKGTYKFSNISFPQFGSMIGATAEDFAEKKTPTDYSERLISKEALMFALFGDSDVVDDADLDDVMRYAAFVRERKSDNKK